MTNKTCLFCGKPLSNKYNKFCNHSCSAKYNNKGRVVSNESNIKRRNTMIENLKDENGNIEYQGTFCKLTYLKCKNCQNMFIMRNYMISSYCKKCIPLIRVEHMDGLNKINKYRNLWHQFSMVSKFYGEIKLDSSWEVKLIKILENNNIMWTRPTTPFAWIDKNNKKRKYFPDIYLPSYKIFIETKNKYLCYLDKDKLDYVKTNYDIKLFVIDDVNNISLEYITENILKNEPVGRIELPS